jgi:hypothetical protein
MSLIELRGKPHSDVLPESNKPLVSSGLKLNEVGLLLLGLFLTLTLSTAELG